MEIEFDRVWMWAASRRLVRPESTEDDGARMGGAPEYFIPKSDHAPGG